MKDIQPDVTSAAVVVPWHEDGSPERSRALGFVLGWWSQMFPGWPAMVAGSGLAEWSKGAAIAAGLRDVPRAVELVVVADADVFMPDPRDISRAAHLVAAGDHEWAIPHRKVMRLTAPVSERAMAGQLGDPGALSSGAFEEPPYTGVECGGLVVLPTVTARAVPCDPRFRGWGGQDWAWSYALRTLAGPPWRGTAPLVHLWHPAQPRINRRVGSQANEQLRLRYARARRRPDEMRRLTVEAITALHTAHP